MTDDLISRQAAIEALERIFDRCEEIEAHLPKGDPDRVGYKMYPDWLKVWKYLHQLPSAQPKKRTEEHTETHACDLIDRQTAIDAHYEYCNKHPDAGFPVWSLKILEDLPSAQPKKRTCVNCGRTANNGGWYADGRTRCPIEEHYALPKDGYCHLWEKRNVTDDDYPERREDERPES